MCRPAGSFAVFVGSNQSLCTNRGRRYRLSRRKSTPRRISGRMWDNLRLFELIWGDTHNVMGHRVSTAEDTRRHRSGCDRLVRVMPDAYVSDRMSQPQFVLSIKFECELAVTVTYCPDRRCSYDLGVRETTHVANTHWFENWRTEQTRAGVYTRPRSITE